MINVLEPRLSARLLASIIQVRIVLATVVSSLGPGIENHYPLMHDPVV
jgi:hypothetical protein